MKGGSIAGAIATLTMATCLCGCGDGDSRSTSEPQPVQPDARQLPKAVGLPVDAGYFDGGVTLLSGPDADSGKPLKPNENAKTFLIAVRFEVEREAILVPEEYFVVIDGRRYRPKGVAFGKARETFFDVEKFVADRVRLEPGGADTIDTDGNGRLNACHLADGHVYLLYQVPGTGTGLLTVRYSGRDHELRPTTAAALGFEDGSQAPARHEPSLSEGPAGLQVEVEESRLAFAEIDGQETEVFEVELKLKSSEYEIVELKLGQDFYLQGHAAPQAGGRARRSGRVFAEYDEDTMRLLTNTVFYDNTYKDRPMKEIETGGLAVSVKPGRPVTVLFVFPNPPFENGLALHFPGRPPFDLIPAGDVLGEIRPAIPRGVAKIPRAPMIGKPVKLHTIKGAVVLSDGRPLNPSSEHRYLAVEFAIIGEQEFAARDYEVTDTAGNRYFPAAVSFGRSPAHRVPGDGYEPIKLVPGEEDRVGKRRGKPVYWEYAKPELLMLFEVPADERTFFFRHGDHRLKLTPVSEPVAWNDLRPESPAEDKQVSRAPDAAVPPAARRPDAAKRNARRAASQLRLGKLLLEKEPAKARAYFEEAIKIAPNSEAANEARKLLEKLK